MLENNLIKKLFADQHYFKFNGSGAKIITSYSIKKNTKGAIVSSKKDDRLDTIRLNF